MSQPEEAELRIRRAVAGLRMYEGVLRTLESGIAMTRRRFEAAGIDYESWAAMPSWLELGPEAGKYPTPKEKVLIDVRRRLKARGIDFRTLEAISGHDDAVRP